MTKILFVLIGLCACAINYSQVAITKPTLSFTACTYPSNYISLGNIRFDETTNADFASGTGRTLIISAPTNFEFEPGQGSVQVANGGDLKSNGISISITSTIVTVTYDCNGTTKADAMLISGLKVRVLAQASNTFSRSGGTAVINGLASGTQLTNTISGQSLPSNTYRSVTNISGGLAWNNASTWECGTIPPNDGTANVIISPFNGTYSVQNAVVFTNSTVNSILIESGANFSPPSNSGTKLVVNDDFTINSGGSFLQVNWTGNGKNAIDIKGDFVNNGTMTTPASNNAYDLDITFNGSLPQTISGTGVFRMIGNGSQTSTLTFDNLKGITLNASFSTVGTHGDAGTVNVNGLLTFGSSSIQFTGAGTTNVNGHVMLKAPTFYGHFANTGSRTLGATSSVEFTNSSSTIASTSIPTMNLYRLIASVGSNGSLTASGNLTVSNRLTLNSGKVLLGTNTLSIGTSLSNPGTIAYSSGFITGKVKRWFNSTNSGNDSGLFPLGMSNKRFFVKVEYTEATDGGTLTAEWIPSSMGTNFTNEPISTSCNGTFEIYNLASGYWSMTPGDGITNAENKKYNITLLADGLLDFTNDCHVTAVKRQGSNPWMQSGTHVDNAGDAISPNVQRIAASGWSNWGFAGGSGIPLPVELISFNSVCDEGSTILTWKTASENNSSSFEIETSTDGETWQTDGAITAAGFSNQELTYNYKIERSGIVIYARLKQIDNNGEYAYYGPVGISCSSAWSISTFPNPSQESFNVVIRSQFSEMNGLLNIVDLSGNKISSRTVIIQEGINVFPSYDEQLTSGSYFIELLTENHDSMVFRHVIR